MRSSSIPLPSSRLGTWIVVATLALLPAATASANDPWTVLESLRVSLANDGPYAARFTQTYIPTGFDSGDQESGHLSLAMPQCLRWQYDQGKSFLICDGTVHQWNEGETAGRVYEIDPTSEPGLDLLLVDAETLRQRYNADSTAAAEAGAVIVLSVPPEKGSFRAQIELDATGGRVEAMEYTDDEGNRTRFEISGYVKLDHMGLFRPPTGIEWTQE